MNTSRSQEWWMWKMYREVAHLIHDPSQQSEARLKTLATNYCDLMRQPRRDDENDPHESLMDYS